MNIHPIFTDEHRLIRDTVRKFVDHEIVPHVEEWERTTFPNELFRKMGKLGLLGLTKPVEYGGQGGDCASGIAMAEELARANCAGLAMGISVHTDMAMPPILAFGSDQQKRDWVIPAILGERILCLGITEPGAGSDVSAARTHARRDGDDYVINGSKTFITNGSRADGMLLLARTDGDDGARHHTLFLVDLHSPGVVREKPLNKTGLHASDTTPIAFQDVRVPSSAVLGEIGQGFRHIMWELQGERLTAAAYCIGAAEWCIEKTRSYAQDREAFGRPISKHQVIAHKLAEMAVGLEAAKQLVYSAAWRISQGDYPVREISIAKLFSTRIACNIADECMQIHGGVGYTKEFGIERVWRDMRIFRIAGGTDEIMLEIISRY